MGKYTEELKYFSILQKNCTCKGCGEEIHGEKLKSYLIDFEKQRQESAENLEIEGVKKV